MTGKFEAVYLKHILCSITKQHIKIKIITFILKMITNQTINQRIYFNIYRTLCFALHYFISL
jgi:hypothetical protein